MTVPADSPPRGKSFDDVASYEREIRQLIPGYALVRQILLSTLSTAAPSVHRIIVVGCGPGDELVAIADAAPNAEIIAVDPEPVMADRAQSAAAAAGLGQRVRVCCSTLAELGEDGTADVVFSSLVGHLIPDEGPRASFYADIGRALTRDGLGLLAELRHGGQAHGVVADVHAAWSQARGLPQARVEALRQRLDGGFELLTDERTEALLERAGLQTVAELVRCLTVVAVAVAVRAPP
ncbi:MAG: class I SAM-dependent methyltransferase [Myxococcota bacterium]